MIGLADGAPWQLLNTQPKEIRVTAITYVVDQKNLSQGQGPWKGLDACHVVLMPLSPSQHWSSFEFSFHKDAGSDDMYRVGDYYNIDVALTPAQ